MNTQNPKQTIRRGFSPVLVPVMARSCEKTMAQKRFGLVPEVGLGPIDFRSRPLESSV